MHKGIPWDPTHASAMVDRAEQPKRSATERIADMLEIYSLYDEETAREQASRCIECPRPACVEGCPLHNRIPEWLALTAEGRFLEAAAERLVPRMQPAMVLAQDGGAPIHGIARELDPDHWDETVRGFFLTNERRGGQQ